MFTRTAAYYDLLYSFKDYAAASEDIRGLIERSSSGAKTVLDVGCGTGRHIEQLRRWYQCEGLDLDEQLLAVARKRNPGVAFHRGDMAKFHLDSRFDVVTCLFSSIGYVRAADRMRAAVASMARHLNPGGLLILEPWVTPERFWPRHIASNHVESDGMKISWMYAHQRQGNVSIFDIHYLVGRFDGVEHFTERHQMGLFSHEEYLEALTSAGLDVDFDESGPFGRGLYVGRTRADVGASSSRGSAGAVSRATGSKRTLEGLAIMGAEPAFRLPLHVGRPNIGDRKRLFERFDDMLERRWLTNSGPYEREFEERVAEIAGVRHCVAISNGTVALELAVRALGLSGEVIVPSFTFVATAHALQWQGIKPVFCDVDRSTHNIDPAKVEALITRRTSGIIGVHVWGRPCDVARLTEIAQRHKLGLLFDAAHAFGCTHGGRPIGSFGNAEVFSFHATKFLNSFEGGAVVTNDDGLAARVRLMKNFGFADYDQVTSVGTNGKLTEAAAAMGITSLESMDRFIEVNRVNHSRYLAELDGIPGVSMARYDDTQRCNCQYAVLEVDESAAGLHRDELHRVLHAENILARRYFYPGCHRMEPYVSGPSGHLHDTEWLTERVLSLPTGTSVDTSDISVVCDVIRCAVKHADAVRARFRASAPPT